jgi:NADH-quinone oxidoreductase subunit L
MLLVLSVVVALAGIVLAWFMYMSTPVRAETIGQPRTVVHRLLLNAWYVDWLYDRIIVRPLFALCGFLAGAVDQGIIDGVVNGVGRLVTLWAAGMRRLQTGYVVNYALTMLAGAVIIVGFLLVR